MREDARTKGRRLVAEGRLTVATVDSGRVAASCKGDSGQVYELGWTPSGWFCTCEARTTCSHLRALQLVVVR